jgi:hypothetical protein
MCVNIYKNTYFPLILETPNYMLETGIAKPKVPQTFTQFLVKIFQSEKWKKADKWDGYLDDVKISKEMADLGCMEPPLHGRHPPERRYRRASKGVYIC